MKNPIKLFKHHHRNAFVDINNFGLSLKDIVQDKHGCYDIVYPTDIPAKKYEESIKDGEVVKKLVDTIIYEGDIVTGQRHVARNKDETVPVLVRGVVEWTKAAMFVLKLDDGTTMWLNAIHNPIVEKK